MQAVFIEYETHFRQKSGISANFSNYIILKSMLRFDVFGAFLS